MKHYDLVIAGGGLAGLSLARQMRLKTPDLSIAIVEKSTFPRPRAIAKVGESTVEIGSRYLSKHVGLDAHLKQNHLQKFGLRIYFGEPAQDLSEQDELGASQLFGLLTYQIDRGDIENHLWNTLRDEGVDIIENADITGIDTESSVKQLNLTNGDGPQSLRSSWLVDAAGRASLIKNHRGLAIKNNHKSNAIWFRVDRTIKVDDWSDNAEWRARCRPEGQRWLSTNHFVGPGYWVWAIPLSSGITSVGIVMDDIAFESANISDKESALRWLHKNQRRYAEAIGDANFLDFVVLRDYSYDCKQVFSDQGWAVTGEAGLFADPFYSPGSDFIAFSNGFISELISSQKRGEDIRLKTILSEKLYKSIAANTFYLYQGQYGGFGDRVMMSLKLLWDYSYYWGVISLLYFGDMVVNINAIRPHSPALMKSEILHQEIQSLFRKRATQRLVLPNRGVFMDQYQIPCLRYFNTILFEINNKGDDHTIDIHAQLQINLDMLGDIAAAVIDMLSDSPMKDISESERAVLGDYRRVVLD